MTKNSNSIHVFGEVFARYLFSRYELHFNRANILIGINQLTANAKKVYVIREKFDTFLEVDVFQLDIRNPVNLIAGKKI